MQRKDADCSRVADGIRDRSRSSQASEPGDRPSKAAVKLSSIANFGLASDPSRPAAIRPSRQQDCDAYAGDDKM